MLKLTEPFTTESTNIAIFFPRFSVFTSIPSIFSLSSLTAKASTNVPSFVVVFTASRVFARFALISSSALILAFFSASIALSLSLFSRLIASILASLSS